MYRPTLRCSDLYKEFVNDLYQTTTLDKNQIMRLLMFTGAHSQEFKNIIKSYLKGDVTPSPPPWRLDQSTVWTDQTAKTKERGSDVSVLTRQGYRESNQNYESNGGIGQATGTTLHQGRNGTIFTRNGGRGITIVFD